MAQYQAPNKDRLSSWKQTPTGALRRYRGCLLPMCVIGQPDHKTRRTSVRPRVGVLPPSPLQKGPITHMEASFGIFYSRILSGYICILRPPFRTMADAPTSARCAIGQTWSPNTLSHQEQLTALPTWPIQICTFSSRS